MIAEDTVIPTEKPSLKDAVEYWLQNSLNNFLAMVHDDNDRETLSRARAGTLDIAPHEAPGMGWKYAPEMQDRWGERCACLEYCEELLREDAEVMAAQELGIIRTEGQWPSK